MNPKSLGDALRCATSKIDKLDARLLLENIALCSHRDLLINPNRLIDSQTYDRFIAAVARRAQGEPIAYILGSAEFHGRSFVVSSAVLIPRPETEGLFERASEFLTKKPHSTVLDLGTGSGILAISLALQFPLARVAAVDFSHPALQVAQQNALFHKAKIEFLQSDWFSELEIGNRRFDVIVANPPYIAAGDPHLPALRFEPTTALVGGKDGLSDLRHIISKAPLYLEAGGALCFEHGHDQAENCHVLLLAAGFVHCFMCPDLSGLPRVSGGVVSGGENTPNGLQ